MRILIVDSNEEELFRLRTTLANYPGIREIHLATDLQGAKCLLAENEFEIAFLDVSWKDLTDLFQSMQNPPHLVLMGGDSLCDSKQDHALSHHWLAKPICERSLLLSLLHVACGRNTPASEVAEPTQTKNRPQRHRLSYSSIIAVEARGNYTNVLCGSKELFDRCRLSQWEALLSDYGFTRLDRSTLIRLDRVHTWTVEGKGASVSFIRSPLKIKIGDVALQRLRTLIPPPHLASNHELGVVCQEPARRWKSAS
jgi:hypothetical protein